MSRLNVSLTKGETDHILWAYEQRTQAEAHRPRASVFQSVNVEFKRLSATPLQAWFRGAPIATNEDREDSSKAHGTPPLMPRPGPTEVFSHQLMQLIPTQNISWPGGEFVWHAWMKCLDCRVMQLLRSGGLVYRKKQPLNHKQTVIIASRFIYLDLSLAPAIHWPSPFKPPPPAPLPITVCGPRKYSGPITPRGVLSHVYM